MAKNFIDHSSQVMKKCVMKNFFDRKKIVLYITSPNRKHLCKKYEPLLFFELFQNIDGKSQPLHGVRTVALVNVKVDDILGTRHCISGNKCFLDSEIHLSYVVHALCVEIVIGRQKWSQKESGPRFILTLINIGHFIAQ